MLRNKGPRKLASPSKNNQTFPETTSENSLFYGLEPILVNL